jgi:hypothetical protein
VQRRRTRKLFQVSVVVRAEDEEKKKKSEIKR